MGLVLDPEAVGLRWAPGKKEAQTRCPFCGEKGGHLYGNRDKGVFYCFVCGASGRLRMGAVALRSHAPAPDPPPVDAGKLDAVYRVLLEVLELSPGHREHLLSPARGLSAAEVEEAGYRSLPEDERLRIGEAVAARVDPSGVPGFWRAGGRWRVSGRPGIVLPVRDARGRVLGIQVRRDAPGDGPRYVWLSSAGLPGGAPARAWCHVSRLGPRRGRRAWVTEGPLKADIAAARLGEPVLAVPGVNTWRSAGLFGALDEVGAEEVVVAYDADAEANPHVDAAARSLVEALLETGRAVWRALWPAAWGKGLDDLLLGGRYPELQEAKGGMCLNRVTLAGQVVQPPVLTEVRRKDGSACLKARVLFEISDDGRREVIPVNAWDRLARRVQEAALAKGDYLVLDGKLKVTRTESGSQLEVWLSDFSVLLKANGHGNTENLAAGAASRQAAAGAATGKNGSGAGKPVPPEPLPPPPEEAGGDLPLEEVQLPWYG